MLVFLVVCAGVYCVVTFGAVLGLLALAEAAGNWAEGMRERRAARFAQAAEREAEAARLLGGPYRSRA